MLALQTQSGFHLVWWDLRMLGVCIGSPPWFSEAIGISEVGYQPTVGPQTPWMRTHLRESSQLAHWQVRTFLTYRVLLAYGEVHMPSLHIASCGSLAEPDSPLGQWAMDHEWLHHLLYRMPFFLYWWCFPYCNESFYDAWPWSPDCGPDIDRPCFPLLHSLIIWSTWGLSLWADFLSQMDGKIGHPLVSHCVCGSGPMG